ncbi:MAG TPA: hypothetical protein VF821_28455 [Lentzea sp.]
MTNRMGRIGSALAAIALAVVSATTLATPASAGEALYKTVRVHNHAWYSLHFNMVYKTDDAYITGTPRRTAVTLGETWQTTAVVDGAREIEFYFWIEAGDTLWYDAGTAAYAGNYCFDTWGTTTNPQILRTDCNTGQVI